MSSYAFDPGVGGSIQLAELTVPSVAGDMLIGDGSANPVLLNIGATGNILAVSGGTGVWQNKVDFIEAGNATSIKVANSGQGAATMVSLATTSNAINSAALIVLQEIASAATAGRSGTAFAFTSNRTVGSGSVADSFDNMLIERTSIKSGGTYTSTGNVLALTNNVSALDTDTTKVLTLTQDTGSTGDILQVMFGASEAFSISSVGDVKFGEGLVIKEQASAPVGDVAGFGQLFVKDDTPNVLIFRDDAGTEVTLGGGAEWTDAGTFIHPTETGDDVGIGGATKGAATINLNADGTAIFSGFVALGAEDQSATAVAGETLRAVDMVGGTTSDAAGADLTVAAGLGTGTGDAGIIDFQLPIVVGAGSSIQTRASRLTLDMVASTTVLTMAAAQAMTITTTTGDLTLAPGGNFDVVIPDGTNVASGLALGSGSDSRIYYDGTDSFWDLQAAGTGDLMIALAAGFPAPDPGQVHIWAGSAGAIVANAASVLTVESNGNTSIQLLAPSTAQAAIFFGNETTNVHGTIIYNGPSHAAPTRMRFGTDSTDRMILYGGFKRLEFQSEFNLTTTTGDLTIAPAASLNVTLNVDDADALDFANDNASYYVIDTRNTAAGTIAHLTDTEDATIASASGAIYSLSSHASYTLNYTGTTQVTSLVATNSFGATLIAGGSAITVDQAATINLIAPTEGTNVTLSNAIALDIIDAGGTPTNQHGIRIATLTAGVTADYAITIGNTDADQNLVHVGVSGDPLFSWDEGNDRFDLTNGLNIGGELLTSGDFTHTGTNFGIFSVTPTTQAAAYTRNATIVEDRTLLASASATATNNNNVIAALIADLQAFGFAA